MRARVARSEWVEVISNVDAQRSAVRSIAWLGVCVAMQRDMVGYFSARFIATEAQPIKVWNRNFAVLGTADFQSARRTGDERS